MSDSKPRELFTVEFQSKTLGTSVFLTRADAEQFANIFKDDPDVRQHPWIVRWVESPQGSAEEDDAELWARDQVVAVRDKLNAVLAEWPQS